MNATNQSSAAGALVKEVLADYGALVKAHVRRVLDGHGPMRSSGVRALYQLMGDYPSRGGRSMRPSICIAAARAFGANVEDAVNTAVALELMHNAFLIHDDIEDDSDERRGRPTMHRQHGVALAIHAGDGLAVLSMAPLIENMRTLGPRLGLRVLEETQRMAMETIEGQAMELWWRESNDVDLDDDAYLDLILKKTCWYSTIYPVRVGALIGSRGDVDLDRFMRFGFFTGAAFQITDDLLNLIGDPERYGKELGGDLYEGKRTLILIHTLRNAAPDERARIAELLSRPRDGRTEEDVAWLRGRIDHHGSIAYAQEVAHGLGGAALHEFEYAFDGLPASRDLDFLEALASWTIERA